MQKEFFFFLSHIKGSPFQSEIKFFLYTEFFAPRISDNSRVYFFALRLGYEKKFFFFLNDKNGEIFLQHPLIFSDFAILQKTWGISHYCTANKLFGRLFFCRFDKISQVFKSFARFFLMIWKIQKIFVKFSLDFSWFWFSGNFAKFFKVLENFVTFFWINIFKSQFSKTSVHFAFFWKNWTKGVRQAE